MGTFLRFTRRPQIANSKFRVTFIGPALVVVAYYTIHVSPAGKPGGRTADHVEIENF
jgi:hypothetical protein